MQESFPIFLLFILLSNQRGRIVKRASLIAVSYQDKLRRPTFFVLVALLTFGWASSRIALCWLFCYIRIYIPLTKALCWTLTSSLADAHSAGCSIHIFGQTTKGDIKQFHEVSDNKCFLNVILLYLFWISGAIVLFSPRYQLTFPKFCWIGQWNPAEIITKSVYFEKLFPFMSNRTEN